MTTNQIITNAATGLAGSMLSVITTFQEELEWYVRMTGGLLGIAIAAISLYRLLKKTKF